MAKKKPATEKRVLTEEAREIVSNCTVNKNMVNVPKVDMSPGLRSEINTHFNELGGQWVDTHTVKFKKEVPEDLFFIPDVPTATEVKAPPKRRQPNKNMSKVSFNTSALENALSKAKEVVDPKTVLPITLNVLMEVEEDRARFVATDVTVTLQVDISVENPDKASFKVLIPFDFLYGVVKLNKNQQLEMETNTNKLIIKGLNDTYEVNVLDDVSEFPKMPDFPEENKLPLGQDVIPIINQALITVSNDTLRPSMTTVCLDLKQQLTTVVSTNSNVLFTCAINPYSQPNEETQLLISKKVAKLLNGFGDTTAAWSDNHIAFTSDSVTVIANKLNEQYPDYKAVIPTDREPNLMFNRVQLMDAITKAMLATDGTHRCNILLKVKIGIIRIEGVDLNRDRNIHVDVPGDYSGECPEVAVDGRYMLDLLRQVDYEDIYLSIESREKGIVLTSSTHGGYKSLIMPLRVND